MKKNIKLYIFTIYFSAIFLLSFSWNVIDIQQILIMIGLVILTIVFNLDVVRDLQSNMTYLILLPFVIPSIAYLTPFYSMLYISMSIYFIFLK